MKGERTFRTVTFDDWMLRDIFIVMTDEDLVILALSLPEATEGAHFGIRDFRVRGKIFMTLPGPDFCVLKLTPDQQQLAMATLPQHIEPVPGGWGLKGSTRLLHHSADAQAVRTLVRRAWRNVAPKSITLTED